MWPNLTCHGETADRDLLRVMNNQASSSVAQFVNAGKLLCNTGRQQQLVSVLLIPCEWQHFNWSWIHSCATDVPCAC